MVTSPFESSGEAYLRSLFLAHVSYKADVLSVLDTRVVIILKYVVLRVFYITGVVCVK